MRHGTPATLMNSAPKEQLPETDNYEPGDVSLEVKADSKTTCVTGETSSTPVRPSDFANLNPQICGNAYCPTVI